MRPIMDVGSARGLYMKGFMYQGGAHSGVAHVRTALGIVI